MKSYDKTVDFFCGCIIKNAVFDEEDNTISLHFDHGILQISDEEQQCYEDRYITVDDNFNDLIGEALKHIIIKNVLEKTDEDGDHDIQFVEIATNKNSIVFCTHNEHNGYYGGFSLRAKIIKKDTIDD